MYRRHFLLFAGLSVILSIPSAALSGYSSYVLFNGLLQSSSSNTGLLAGALLAFAIVGVVILALSPFLYGAITYAACESALGRPVSAIEIVRGVMHRYFSLLGFGLILGLIVGVGFCLVPLWVWLSVNWIVVIPVMYVEDVGLGAAMTRSWRLVEGRWWRTFLILFLISIVFVAARLALSAFIALAQLLLAIVFPSVVILWITSAVTVVADSVVNPVIQISIVLIYFDLRVRREALDLFQLAQRLAPRQLAT